MKKSDKFISWLVTAIGFLMIFSIYAFNLEDYFIIKREIIKGLVLNFPLPFLFFTVIFIYTFIYSRLFNRKLLETIFLILPLAIFWKLVFFLIEMIGFDPWKGKNVVFTIYSHIYLVLIVSSCLIIIYKLKNHIRGIDKPIVVIPGIAWAIYLIFRIIQTRSYLYMPLILITSLTIYFLLKLKHLFKFLKEDWLFAILIFILAFGVRFGWGLRVVSITGNNFYAASDDGLSYGPFAEDWVKGISHSPVAIHNGFGYWLFLGLIYRLFGNPNYFAAIFIQAILGGLVPVFIYYIAKFITHRPIAKASAILVSLNMNNIFTSIVIGMEALFIPLLFLSLFLLLKYINNGKIVAFKYPFFIGILLGVTNIVRPEILLFCIVISLCFFLYNKKRFSLRQAFKVTIVLSLGFLIILFLFCLRNYIKVGKFDFKSGSAAVGFSLVSPGGVAETKILSDMGFNPFRDLGGSLKIIIKQPLQVSSLLLKGISKKGFNYLFVPNFGSMDFLTLLNNVGAIRYLIYCKFYIYLFVLLGLIILACNRKFLLEKSILFWYIVYTVLFYATIFTTNARYRAVLEPLFIMLFINAIYFIITRFKKTIIDRLR